MVTPLEERDVLDHAGLERLVEHLVAGGVSGLFVLGTTGEAPSLSYRLRYEVVERVGELLAGRVPLLVGITDAALAESLELAERAYDAGASAVVAAPPYYYPLSQSELTRHFERLVAESPLPLVLYNMPSCTKVAFELETVLRLSQLPGVIGLKDSSGDLDYFRRVRGLLPDRDEFRLFVGPEELLSEAIAAGADGGVSGGANMFPQLYVELCRAAHAKDWGRAGQLQGLVMQLSSDIYSLGEHAAGVIQGIKTVLAQLGICRSTVAEPLGHFDSGRQRQIARRLRQVQARLAELLGPEAAYPAAREEAAK
jgi:4-hydroxy-tetrahydrodipicolinate synthase